MRNANLYRSCVASAFAATFFGFSFGLSPAAAEPAFGARANIQVVQSICGTLGPYATIRRANEVANYYRGQGCWVNTPYHNGNGYYISGCC